MRTHRQLIEACATFIENLSGPEADQEETSALLKELQEAANQSDALYAALRAYHDWASRMPDAGFNDKSPRWAWWHERPQQSAEKVLGVAPLVTLIGRAASHVITAEEAESQRRGFAHGNVSIHNPNVTCTVVDAAAERFARPARAGTSMVCRACGCRWKVHADGTLQLYDADQKMCARCDNAPNPPLRFETPFEAVVPVRPARRDVTAWYDEVEKVNYRIHDSKMQFQFDRIGDPWRDANESSPSPAADRDALVRYLLKQMGT